MTAANKDSQHRYIGKPQPRIDGAVKVTGQAKYVHDMSVGGMLYARIKTSPHASARIVSMDCTAAEKLPGVHAVVTGAELPHKMGLYMVDKDILAKDRVRYNGEPVAAVVAEEEWIAEKACELIEIAYEPLPPVLDPREAIKPGAPLVHPDLGKYNHMKGVFHPQADTNIPHHQKVYRGDVEKGFAEADRIFEHSFFNPPVSHGFLETHTAIVQAFPDGKVDIITSAQSPYTVRKLFSVCFDLPLSDIQVQVPYVGGGFGGKAGIHIEPLVYCLSRAANFRPVKLTITREESLFTMPARPGLHSDIKTGVKKDGRITALQAAFYWDSGAYADYAVNIGRAAAYSGAGPYEVPNCKIDSYIVYTNKTYGTAYRGFGHLEVLWGIERNLDIIAGQLGLDTYEIRQRNYLRPGALTITGEKITDHHGRPDLCLEKVSQAIELGSEKPAGNGTAGKYRGKGIASLHKAPAMPTNTSCAATIKFNEDATADVLVTGVDYGQGTYTVLAQVAAEELRMPVEMINVVWDCDTRFTPYDWQTVASRFAYMGGNAIIQAARDCLKQFKAMAAAVLRAPVESLICEDAHVYVDHHPDEKLPYTKLVMGYVYPNGNAIGGPVIGHGRCIAQGLTHLDEYGQGMPALDWTYGAHGAEIEVDVNTGEIRILNFASAFDVGKMLNEQQVVTQIIGGVVQGIGSALFEEYLIHGQTGKFCNPSLVDYKIPTANDIPLTMSQHIIETAQPGGPYGARGMAEHPMISVPSAIANALQDALGVDIRELPMTHERVYYAIKEQLKK